MDAISCKMFASLCIWAYVLIECHYAIPFHGLLSSDDKFAREVAGMNDVNENEQRIREEDLRKLILKKLRFRDIDENSYPVFSDNYDASELGEEKQKRNTDMLNKLTEMLNGLKTRQLDSPKVRMSSLRFGR